MPPRQLRDMGFFPLELLARAWPVPPSRRSAGGSHHTTGTGTASKQAPSDGGRPRQLHIESRELAGVCQWRRRMAQLCSIAREGTGWRHRRVIAMLFEHGKNPIQLFKIKDWPKVLEYATDKAEDAASSGSEIVLKSARSNF